MYHIANDKRATRSAENLYQGLIKCMETKTFQDISVTEVIRHSKSSRTTFYRLFDNIHDVLYWKCEQIMMETLSIKFMSSTIDTQKMFLIFISFWMQNQKLLKLLIQNDLTDILYQLHLDHIEEIKVILFTDERLSTYQQEYIASLLASMMPVVFKNWVKYPDQTAEEILSQLQENISIIKEIFCY